MARVRSTQKFIVGPDLNIEKEIWLDKKGERYTQARLQSAAAETIRTVGRQSLSKPNVHSPQVRVRVPESLKLKLDRAAKRRGVTPSEVVREALEQYLKSA